LAEDCLLYAFTGAPDAPSWLAEDDALELLEATPSGNVAPDLASHHLSRILDHGGTLIELLAEKAEQRGGELLDAHQRVRRAARARGVRQRVEPKLPVDVLGVYIYLPV
jgi:hypothetical protein